MIRFVYYLIVCAFTSVAIGAAWADETPAVAFEDADGNPHTLAELKGRPVVLNLWATWCAPCVAEMPLIADMQQQYAGRGLVVLALSEDGSRKDAPAFYASSHITGLAPYFDAGHHVMRTLHANGVPTSYLINKDGDVVKIMQGYIDWQSPDMQKMLSSWLASLH